MTPAAALGNDVSTVREVARAHPRLAVFSAAYLAVFLVAGLAIGSDVAIPYVVLIIAIMAFVCRLDRPYELGGGVLWGLSVWGLLHLAGGIVPIGSGGGVDDRTLYNAVLPLELFHFDRLVHAFGFGMATVACGKVLLRLVPSIRPAWPDRNDSSRPTTATYVLIVLAGLGVGAANEILEFISTLVLPETNVGGYDNTGWDLIFDLAGGIIGTVWLARRPREGGADG